MTSTVMPGHPQAGLAVTSPWKAHLAPTRGVNLSESVPLESRIPDSVASVGPTKHNAARASAAAFAREACQEGVEGVAGGDEPALGVLGVPAGDPGALRVAGKGSAASCEHAKSSYFIFMHAIGP